MTNSTGKDISVNGNTVGAGETVTIEHDMTDDPVTDPTAPSGSENTDKLDGSKNNPQTGDDVNIILIAIVMTLAVMGTIGITFYVGRRNTEK